jgi:Ser-tRNA(Ala) deacylase AlaX
MDMTDLVYIAAPDRTDLDATINAVEHRDGRLDVVLDRTPFYPQGGGQPSDTGSITGEGFTVAVRKAILIDGVVHHEGVAVEGTPVLGTARVRIDTDRRATHAALHTAGHLVMTAMFELTGLRAVKGYHFPDGPYVEFDGAVENDAREAVADALQQRLEEMVATNAEVGVESTTVGELQAAGVYMPGDIPADKPTRVVTTFGYRSPCGGTHAARTGDVAGLRVRRIKVKASRTRVGYELADK